MRSIRYCLFVLCVACHFLPARAEPLPQVRLQIGMRFVQAEVAATPGARTVGLMHRTELGKNQGMLFIFDGNDVQAMWMRNTLIPLSVAFLDQQGVIVNIAEMLPLTETAHASSGPAKYALEMNAGWFTAVGARPGDKVKGLPGL
jgi:uncharacterized membrane protein (UPF0127 family)